MKLKPSRTELICLAAAALFIALAIGLRLGSGAGREARVFASLITPSPTESAAVQREGKLDINLASAGELMLLPGIGEVRAAAIVEYRETHGPFESVSEIMDVKGVGEGIFEDIRDFITVGEYNENSGG